MADDDPADVPVVRNVNESLCHVGALDTHGLRSEVLGESNVYVEYDAALVTVVRVAVMVDGERQLRSWSAAQSRNLRAFR